MYKRQDAEVAQREKLGHTFLPIFFSELCYLLLKNPTKSNASVEVLGKDLTEIKGQRADERPSGIRNFGTLENQLKLKGSPP